ncbi:MAG: hypothetical protein Q4B06_02240 [Candidatus Saccharibacteria bacterium]|nr:hypothetical protein [Candidatus Saccharibacteria bacterium]
MLQKEEIQFIKHLNEETFEDIVRLVAKLEVGKLNSAEKEQLVDFLSDRLDSKGIDGDEINSLGERIDDIIGRIMYDI